MTDSAPERRRLAELLADNGVLTSPWLRAAVEAVPRELFLHPGVFLDEGGTWRPVTATGTDPAEWLKIAYSYDTLTTQLDGHLTADQAVEPVAGVPTSSSTTPATVVGMIESLGLETGHRVLEIGTGTGYSSALMCHYLGGDNVTTVEVDPAVAERADTALETLGLLGVDRHRRRPPRPPPKRAVRPRDRHLRRPPHPAHLGPADQARRNHPEHRGLLAVRDRPGQGHRRRRTETPRGGSSAGPRSCRHAPRPSYRSPVTCRPAPPTRTASGRRRCPHPAGRLDARLPRPARRSRRTTRPRLPKRRNPVAVPLRPRPGVLRRVHRPWRQVDGPAGRPCDPVGRDRGGARRLGGPRGRPDIDSVQLRVTAGVPPLLDRRQPRR